MGLQAGLRGDSISGDWENLLISAAQVLHFTLELRVGVLVCQPSL